MSRLQRLEEKRNLRKAIWLAIGTVVLIVFVVVIGVPALVRLVTWIGESKSAGVKDKNDLIPPSPPRIITSWDATNSALMTVTGFAEPKASVYLTLNAESKGDHKTGDDGQFVFENIALSEGENKLIAVAIDEAGNQSQPSRTVSVIYSKKEPKLDIESPTNSQEFSGSKNQIEIKGVTDPESRVTVNGRILIVGSDGKFTSFYSLSNGENKLEFIATNRAGNQTKKELTVTYAP